MADTRADVVALRLFDMWDDDHYRDDELWTAHRRFWPMLVRRDPALAATWPCARQHCGRFPREAVARPCVRTPLRIQHLGWMRQADRVAKHARYLQLDPDGAARSLAHYRSILDPAPRLARSTE